MHVHIWKSCNSICEKGTIRVKYKHLVKTQVPLPLLPDAKESVTKFDISSPIKALAIPFQVLPYKF